MNLKPRTDQRSERANHSNSDVSAKLSSGLTPRAFGIGAILSLIIGVGVPYSNMALRGTRMAIDFSTPAALFLFFLFAGGANVILGLIHRRLSLRRGELVTIYIMMIIATAIPSNGLTQMLLPVITGAFYYATPENNWADMIHPYLSSRLVPQDSDAIVHFYEGLPEGVGIPWGIWVRPLLHWIPFALALYFVSICLMSMLRRQWVENERLTYPLVQVPLAMIQEGERPSWMKPFFKNPVMWIGFVIPLIVGSINALNSYYPFIPPIRLNTSISLFRRTMSLPLNLNFPMLGFSYFINPDVALGLWVFCLIGIVAEGIFNITGLQEPEKMLSAYSKYKGPILIHQAMGAMIVMVLFGLWTAREHIRNVFRKAFRGDPNVDDSEEILPYRVAVFGAILGVLFMSAWLCMSGMPAWVVPIFLFGALVVFVATTRLVIEGGVAILYVPLKPPDFLVSTIGTSVLGMGGLVALGFTYVWSVHIMTHVMASCANGLRLAQEITGRKRPLFWAMALAIVLVLAGSVWMVLKFCYEAGGINVSGYFFESVARYPFDDITRRITVLHGPYYRGWVYTVIGGAIMGLLMFARHRLLWWPLHPLGFPVSPVFDGWAFTVFLAWLLKSTVLKYGGPKLYRSSRFFFLGLILGQFVTAGMWLVINYFTKMSDVIVF